jgi:hypothetical protein
VEIRRHGLARRVSRPFPWVVCFAVLLVVLVPLGRIATLTVLGAVCDFLGVLILAGWLAIPWVDLRRILHGRINLPGLAEAGIDVDVTLSTKAPTWEEAVDQLWGEIGQLRRDFKAGDKTIDTRIDALERSIPETIRRHTRAPIDGMVLLAAGLVMLSAASLLSAAR